MTKDEEKGMEVLKAQSNEIKTQAQLDTAKRVMKRAERDLKLESERLSSLKEHCEGVKVTLAQALHENEQLKLEIQFLKQTMKGL